MNGGLTLRISSPLEALELEDVGGLRFEAPDGLRGVRPGHEPALAVVRPGVLRLVQRQAGAERTLYVACEGGFLEVSPREALLTTSWFVRDEDLGALVAALERRGQRRQALDQEARRLTELHELAARRALARLQREVRR
ncbi:MAG: hypothetical protein R3F62_17630 [Planctomycetota bacterium]